ncbi:MAG: hypothetical protein V9E83_00015 [Baekduia sp.]
MTGPFYTRTSDGRIEHVDISGQRSPIAPAMIEHVPLADCESSAILTDALGRANHSAGTYRNRCIVIGRNFPLPESPGLRVTEHEVLSWFEDNRGEAELAEHEAAERARREKVLADAFDVIAARNHYAHVSRRVFEPSSMAVVRKLTQSELEAHARRLENVYRRFGARYTPEDVVLHYERKFSRRFGSRRVAPKLAAVFGTPFAAPDGHCWTGISFLRWGSNTLVPIERWNDPDWAVPPENVWPASRARDFSAGQYYSIPD